MTSPKTISISDYFKECADSFDLDALKRAPIMGSITPEQLSKYDIKACIVTYKNIDAVTVNPASWAHTEYYISDTMYKEDDTDKSMPFKVFVGEKD